MIKAKIKTSMRSTSTTTMNKQSSRNKQANKVKAIARQSSHKALSTGPKKGRDTSASTLKKPPKSMPGFAVYSSESEVEEKKSRAENAKFLKRLDEGGPSKTVFDPKDTCLNRDEDIVSQMQIVEEKRRIAGIVIPTAAMESPARSEEMPPVSTPFNTRLVSSTPDPEKLQEAELLEQQQKIASILLADTHPPQRPGIRNCPPPMDLSTFQAASVPLSTQTTNTTHTDNILQVDYPPIFNSPREDAVFLHRSHQPRQQRQMSPQMIPERDYRGPAPPPNNEGLERLSKILQEQKQLFDETEFLELPAKGESATQGVFVETEIEETQQVSKPLWQNLLNVYQLPVDAAGTSSGPVSEREGSFQPVCVGINENQNSMITSTTKAEWIEDSNQNTSMIHCVDQSKTSSDGASTESIMSHPYGVSSLSSSHSHKQQVNGKKDNILTPHDTYSSFDVVKTSSMSSSTSTPRCQKSSSKASQASSTDQHTVKGQRRTAGITFKHKLFRPQNSKAPKCKVVHAHKRGEDVPPSTVQSNNDSNDLITSSSVQTHIAPLPTTSVNDNADSVNLSVDTCDEEVNRVISSSETDRNRDGINVDVSPAPESSVSESSNLSHVIELLKSDILMHKKGSGGAEVSTGTKTPLVEPETSNTEPTTDATRPTAHTNISSPQHHHEKVRVSEQNLNSLNISESQQSNLENFNDPMTKSPNAPSTQSTQKYPSSSDLITHNGTEVSPSLTKDVIDDTNIAGTNESFGPSKVVVDNTNKSRGPSKVVVDNINESLGPSRVVVDNTNKSSGATKDSGMQEASTVNLSAESRDAENNINQNHNYGEDQNFSRRRHNLDYLDKMADPRLRDIACQLAFKATALRDVELRDLIDDMIFHTDAALAHEDARFQSTQMFFAEENNKLKKRVQTINRQLEAKERQERMGRNTLGMSNNDVLHLERKTMYLQQEKDRLDSQVTTLLEEKARWLITQQDLVKAVSLKDHELLKLEEKHQSEKMRLHQSLDAATKNSQGVHYKLAVADREVANLEQKLKTREGEIAELNDRVREAEEGRRRCEAGLRARDAEMSRLQDLVDTLKLGVEHVLQAYESSPQTATQHQSRGMDALRLLAHPEDYRIQTEEGTSRKQTKSGENRHPERRHEERWLQPQEQHRSQEQEGRDQHFGHHSRDRHRQNESFDGNDYLTTQMLAEHNRHLSPFDHSLWRSLDDGPVAPPVDDLDPYYSDSEIQVSAKEKRRRSAAREKRRSDKFATADPRRVDDREHAERRARLEAQRKIRLAESEYLNNGRVHFQSDRREDPRSYYSHPGTSQVERAEDIRKSSQRLGTHSRDRRQHSGKHHSHDQRDIEAERRPGIRQFDDSTRREESHQDTHYIDLQGDEELEYPDIETVPIPSDDEWEHSRYSVTDYFRSYPSAQRTQDSRNERELEGADFSTLRSKTLSKASDNNRSFPSVRPTSMSRFNASYEGMARLREDTRAPYSHSRHLDSSQFLSLSADPDTMQYQGHTSGHLGGPSTSKSSRHHSSKHTSSSPHHVSHSPRVNFVDSAKDHANSDLMVFERDESFQTNSHQASFRNQSSPIHISDISESRRATMGAGSASQQDFFQGTELSASLSSISDSEPGPSSRNNNNDINDKSFSTGIATLDAKIAKLHAKINRTKAIFS